MAKVISIEEAGEQEVFDLEIEGPPVFELMAGPVVHNSKHYLGRDVKTFEELVGKNVTIDQLSPEEVVYYASSDTANTYGLFRVLYDPIVKECRETIKIDNHLVRAMFHYMQSEIFIDTPLMEEMAKEFKEKIMELEFKIFKMVGYPFKLDSNRELSQALQSLGVDTGITTKTGDMKLDEKNLSKINHPICKMVVERNSLVKQLGSYIEKFVKQGPTGRIQYFLFRVPTGRLASGNKDNPYFMGLNGQNLTKPDPMLYLCEEDDGPESILGYRFFPCLGSPDSRKKYVEGMSPEGNIRRAITVPSKQDWYFCGIDFCLSKKSTVETREGVKGIDVVRDFPGVEVRTPQGWKRAFDYRETGKRKRCVLILKSGKRLVCSPDHRVRVWVEGVRWEERRVKDLVASDVVDENGLLTSIYCNDARSTKGSRE